MIADPLCNIYIHKSNKERSVKMRNQKILRNIAGFITGLVVFLITTPLLRYLVLFILKVPFLNWILTYPTETVSTSLWVIVGVPCLLAILASYYISERTVNNNDIGSAVLSIFLALRNIVALILSFFANTGLSFSEIITLCIVYGCAIGGCIYMAVKLLTGSVVE